VNEAAKDVIFEFGGFELDPRRQTVRRWSDGQPLDLTPRIFATLLHLVEHAGQLVDKRALLAAVWPNVVVEDSSLTQAIHVLRRLLGEHPDDHRFVVTVPGRGYRFVADVVTRSRQETAAPGDRQGVAQPARWPWRRLAFTAGFVALLAVLVLVLYAVDTARRPDGYAATRAQPAIAVLPFVDLSPKGDYAYFSDGLAEEVLGLLSQAPDLAVIARTSSFSFRDRDVDIATIARKLKVGYVLEGSVRRDGRRVRITAQLIETVNSSQLWSATFDRELDDVLAAQREIAAAVASALQVKLASRTATAAPRNAQAYDDFLRGRFFYARRGPGDLERALHYYGRAAANEPEDAQTWAGVAGVSWVMTAEGLMPRETGLPRVLEAAQRAIALDPNLAEAHVRLANYYYLAGDDHLADEHFARAAMLHPSDPLVLGIQAGIAAKEGRLDQAIELQRQIASADPLSAVVVNNLGHMLFAAGRLDAARVELLKALELSPGSAAAGTVAQILVLQREFDAAIEFTDRSAQGPDREQGLALVHHALGRTAEADAALAKLISLSATEDPFRLAEVYAYRGEVDESFEWLALAARPSDPDGMLLPAARNMWEMRASPLLESLHSDPRWAAWIAGPT